jgi:hypothetical protein
VTITLSYDPPAEVIAGDSIEFLCRVPGDYASWTGSARLTGPDVMAHTTCATEGDALHVYFKGQGTPGTKTLPAGHYLLSVWVSLSFDRKTIAQYPLTITADVSTGTPDQPHAVEMLAVIEAAIAARLSGNSDGGIESYAMDGVQVNKLSMPDLQRLRNKYAREVAAINNPNGQIPRLKVSFTKAGGIPDLRRRFM